MIVMGIDQGLGGAVAVLRAEGPMILATPIIKGKRKQFDEPGMLQLLQHCRMPECEWHAFLESVQPMPDKPVMAAISQGLSDGLWRMALVASGISYTRVNPRKWQNVMLAGVAGDDTKQRSILAAKRLFPNVFLRASERCRVDNHNFADALLIAEYGRRTLGR